MSSHESASIIQCLVCSEVGHQFQRHMSEVETPAFVGSTVSQLRVLEWSGSDVHPLVTHTQDLANGETGGRKAWALWLLTLLEELEEASDVPEVAAEIENYLLGGYWA